ncbi:hypothetical protein MTO96_043299 [Rhipicephalus appendiculatus]
MRSVWGALIPRRTCHVSSDFIAVHRSQKKEGTPESQVTCIARNRTSPEQVTLEGTLRDATMPFQEPLAFQRTFPLQGGRQLCVSMSYLRPGRPSGPGFITTARA